MLLLLDMSPDIFGNKERCYTKKDRTSKDRWRNKSHDRTDERTNFTRTCGGAYFCTPCPAHLLPVVYTYTCTCTRYQVFVIMFRQFACTIPSVRPKTLLIPGTYVVPLVYQYCIEDILCCFSFFFFWRSFHRES